MTHPPTRHFKKSHALFQRAAQVIPGGIYGHTSPALTVPGAFPYYAARGLGTRYWDEDGNEFIDYLGGYGPLVLGYRHPEVEEAAERQQREGSCFNHPHRLMVELAERLVELIDFAAWAVFGKNGSDMTTWALQVAREKTRRKKVLKITGSYHGIDPWCTPGHAGLIEEDREHIHDFPWNDLNRFDALIARHRGQIAAFISTPFHHPAYDHSVLPAPGFFAHIQEVCRREGIVFILDDIRAGFRLHLGGSHRHFGFDPDISCYCKAIANGHPLSAAVGRVELKAVASKVFLTGSYWNSAAPMAAALACLQVLQRDEGVEKMRTAGERLMQGLARLASEEGFTVICSGPPAMPLMMFAHDPGLRKQQRFCVEAVQRGVFFHPHHNWFVSTAHTDAEVDATLQIARESFRAVRAAGLA